MPRLNDTKAISDRPMRKQQLKMAADPSPYVLGKWDSPEAGIVGPGKGRFSRESGPGDQDLGCATAIAREIG